MIDSVFIPRYAPSQEKVPKVLFNDGLRPCCGPVLWPSDDPDDPITNQFIWRGYVVTSARFYLDLSAVELADFDYAGSTYEFFRLKNQNEVLYWIGRPTPSTPETSGGPLYARALEGETASGGLRVELILAWDFETEVATVYAYPGIGDSETDRIFEWIFDFSPVDPYDQFSKFVAVDSSDGESGARLACWPRNMHALGDAQRAWPRVVTTGLGG
ncbi:MAG: hypothetical protein PF795_04590, partial [Kiritimatiellae bacterium]|nr:hypothetical protein [Kiritimatiellia bacterium]